LNSLILWIGTAAVLTFNFTAIMLHGQAWTYAALALTGVFALFGIGFGIWAGRTQAKGPDEARPTSSR
jgi:hypothetical protein